MNDNNELKLLLGRAALKLWSDLPRAIQENLFEAAVPLNVGLRNRLAVFLHEHHPKTAHPPLPSQTA